MGIIDYDTSSMSSNSGYNGGFSNYNGGFRTTQGTAGEKYPYDYNNPKHIDLDKVYSLTPADYGLTVEGIKQYIYGIRVIDPDTGDELPQANWNTFIDKAVAEIEHLLNITIFPTVETRELSDYDESDFIHNNLIITHKRPIIQVQQVEMLYNNQPIMRYPTAMWKVYHLYGQIQTYPVDLINGLGSINTNLSPITLGLAGNTFLSQMSGNTSRIDAPQFNAVTYVAGLLPQAYPNRTKAWEMPADLKALIAKYTIKEALEIWGELILKPGQAKTSLNVDGMGQTIDTTLSAENTGATARLKLIDKECDILTEGLRNYFGGGASETFL